MKSKKTIRKILIANRGEIAVRIMRSCRDLSIGSVAVYSDIDRNALHVQYADEAYHIGGNSARESYLVMEKIIDTALKAGCDAIHPGYGFLAENAAFCSMCQDGGLIFIGPDASAIEKMGNKTFARQLMQKAGVPVIPGTTEALPELVDDALPIAREIGFPLLIKAAAGGGGKGMRLVTKEEEFPEALRHARSEARSSFGDDTVYLERYIQNPHHVEIQIIGDIHGNVVYLYERECSIQRRHQKVIEECPSPFITSDLRREMGEAACAAAKSVNYVNAGTIEFIVDGEMNFYFLEMNTRLQVEHPVTELVTGKDLVQLQIAIAQGEEIPFTQEEIPMRGHAIECRIYAEDPARNFMPAPGRIQKLTVPAGPGIRDDGGAFSGCEIPMFYDPLISKLSTWGETRQLAINRMVRALSEYKVTGVTTNITFLKWILQHPVFEAGCYDTGFIGKYYQPQKPKSDALFDDLAAAVASIYRMEKVQNANNQSTSPSSSNGTDKWKIYSRNRFLSSRL